MRTRIQIPIENTITRSIITNRKTVKKREREAKHCNICGTDKREQKGESKNLLFMSTSAFLQTILAKRRPIPLMEVRANMIFCFPSTFVLSTRSMCWNSSFATKDWHRQIKKHVNQTWERERKRYRSRHRLNHSPWLGFQMKLCEAVRLRRLQSAEKSKETETLDSQWRFKTFI